METRFEVGALPVQVIVLVQPSEFLENVSQRETLRAVLATPVARRVLAAGGAGEDWAPAGFDLMRQRGSDFGERLAAAFADAHATAALPMLLIRSDALDVPPDMIEDAARSLVSGEADAAFGPASDGGFWLLGLRRPDRSLVVGVPAPGASAGTDAGRLLRERLISAGLRLALAPRLDIFGAPALRF
jgi:glycosyltransferase A (GT-A) superfamily protein (DUF2064 family)